MASRASRRFFPRLVVVLSAGAGLAMSVHDPGPAPVAPGPSPRPARVSRSPFGQTSDGQAVEVATLGNRRGLELRVMSFGGVILSLRAPDRAGRLDDVVLGYDDLAPYLANSSYFGCIVGRYANRIAQARFVLDGKTYSLATNDGPNHLHGGRRGWHLANWAMEAFEKADRAGVTLSHTSPDGDEGYPGRVVARVTYTLDDENRLSIDYHATTDATTVVNLTQHTYFNLAGAGTATILDHELSIEASRYTPVDERLIPLGDLAPVADTPLDFRTARRIGARIEADHVQMRRGRGYDHNWVVDGKAGSLRLAARLVDPSSGRTLEVRTTEPGIQFYSGNFLDGTVKGKGGRVYGRRSGLCLETEHFPDSPNRKDFPSTTLRPGEEYRSQTVWTFGVAR